MEKFLKVMVLVAFCVLFGACGGGSGSGDNQDNTGGTNITSLSDIPDDLINPQAYDLTTQSLPASTSIAKAEDAPGEGFSRAGCETNQMKKDIIRNAIFPRMILCKMKAFEAAADESAEGEGEFNYWKMSPPRGHRAGPQGIEVDPRLAIKIDSDEFVFVMCNGTTKAMELLITTSDGGFEGHVIDIWGDDQRHKLEFSADGLPTDPDFENASFTQAFSEASEYFSGYGSASLDATPTYNVVHGFHSGELPGGGGVFSGATYAMFDANEGSAAYRMDSGHFPAETLQDAFDRCVADGHCPDQTVDDWLGEDSWLATECGLDGLTVDTRLCFSRDCAREADEDGNCSMDTGDTHIESFTIDNSDPENLLFAFAATSAYADDVAAAEIPSSSSAPTIAFTSTSADVDCAGSDSWPDVTFVREPDDTDCQAMEEEMNNWQPDNLCADEEAQQEAGGPR
jgi:hypothetical protein